MQGTYAQINVVAKAEFTHDIVSESLSLDSLPANMAIQKGDYIRLVIRENPTTGFYWHTNASRSQDAAIREVYNGFEAPNDGLMGSPGKRVLVFQINEPSSTLGLGQSRSYNYDASEWEGLGSEETLNSEKFSKTIVF